MYHSAWMLDLGHIGGLRSDPSTLLMKRLVYSLVVPVGGNTEKWDPPDGPCFHTEREELSLSFQTLQKSLKNIKMVQNGDRKTPAPQRSRLLSSQMRQVRPLLGKRMMAAKEKPQKDRKCCRSW